MFQVKQLRPVIGGAALGFVIPVAFLGTLFSIRLYVSGFHPADVEQDFDEFPRRVLPVALTCAGVCAVMAFSPRGTRLATRWLMLGLIAAGALIPTWIWDSWAGDVFGIATIVGRSLVGILGAAVVCLSLHWYRGWSDAKT